MKLFDIVPEKFFSILSSPKKEIYSDCLFILYRDLKNNTSFGIDREIVLQTLMDYFEGLENKNIFDDEDETVKTSREEANFAIRKLKDSGWIDIDITTSYKQIINFTDYSIAFLEAMDKLIKNEKLEYQGYVYTIYSILFTGENNQYSVMLEQVYDNTNRLMTGLKSLNSNIKKYIDKITAQKSSEEIMKLHFEGYTQDIIDKGYHRLKTSDNVSKFRPRIIGKLEEIKRDSEYIKTACSQSVEMERHSSFEEAYEDIMNRINGIIYAFENMDTIINEIDRKNTHYIKASLTRVKYLLNSSKDLSGQVTDILKYMISVIESQNLDIKEDSMEEIENLFEFFSQSFIDEKSMYTVSEVKPEFKPQSIELLSNMSKQSRELKIKEVAERNKRRLSRENIDRFVLEMLGDREVINASMLPLNDINDFIKFIYILVYSKSRLVHYSIKRLNNEVRIKKFTFKDFEIWRKQNDGV